MGHHTKRQTNKPHDRRYCNFPKMDNSSKYITWKRLKNDQGQKNKGKEISITGKGVIPEGNGTKDGENLHIDDNRIDYNRFSHFNSGNLEGNNDRKNFIFGSVRT